MVLGPELVEQISAAMHGYAGASSVATTLTPFSAPTQNTNRPVRAPRPPRSPRREPAPRAPYHSCSPRCPARCNHSRREGHHRGCGTC
jgi:hypothetical protein